MSCNQVLTESCRVNRVTGSTRWISRVFDFSYFFKPGSVPTLGHPGPESTRQVRPGFKTMRCWLYMLQIIKFKI